MEKVFLKTDQPEADAQIIGLKRKCSVCNHEKFLTFFPPRKGKKFNRAHRCRSCSARIAKRDRALKGMIPRRAEKLWKKYKLTLEAYQTHLVSQKFSCAICAKPFLADGQASSSRPTHDCAVVDHSHRTNKVRGILCHACNVALGHFKDNPTVCRLAAAYLERAE